MKRKVLVSLGLSLCFTAMLAVAQEADAAQTMHRMYNPNSGEHFYTANGAEKDMLVNVGWNYEGTGWIAPDAGPDVYRMYNANAGDHHYTMNPAERDMLVKVGWKYEGVGWKTDNDNGVALHRLYNPNAIAGSHHYTTNAGERDSLAAIGWRKEGIGWYGMNPNQKYIVKIIHKGSDGKTLNQETVSVKRDSSYTAKAKSFGNYSLKGNNSQTVKADANNKAITFNYTKNNAVSANKAELQKVYDDLVASTNFEDYTGTSVYAFTTALVNVRDGVLNNSNATQAEVNKAIQTLKDAKNKMVYTKDLKVKVNAVKDTAKGNYTDESWNTFQTALSEANTVLKDISAVQADVNAALTKLTDAHKNLTANPVPVTKFNVTVVHKGNDGVTLQTENAVQIEKGEEITASAKTFDGYTLQGDSTQTFTVNEDLTITFNYTKDSVSPEEDLKLIASQIARDALDEVNDLRQSSGLKPLAMDDALQRAAMVRAQELYIELGPKRPGGLDGLTAVTDEGYTGEALTESSSLIDPAKLEYLQSRGASSLVGMLAFTEEYVNNMLSPDANEGAIGVHITPSEYGDYSMYFIFINGKK